MAHAITSSGGSDAGFAAPGAGRQRFRTPCSSTSPSSVQTVFYLMAGVMALAFVVAVLGVPHGRGGRGGGRRGRRARTRGLAQVPLHGHACIGVHRCGYQARRKPERRGD